MEDKKMPLSGMYADELEGPWEWAYRPILRTDGSVTTAVFIDELAKHVFSAEGAWVSDEELERRIDSACDRASAKDKLLSEVVLRKLSEAVGYDVVREWAEEGRRKILAEKDAKEGDRIVTTARRGRRCTKL